MTKKIQLAKGEVKGNLRKATQKYYINFLPKVVENNEVLFLDKIEFSLLTPSVKGSDEPVYRSLRFDDPAQLYLFVIDLLIAFAYFKRSKFELSEQNIHFYQSKLSGKFLDVMKDVMRGVYDG